MRALQSSLPLFLSLLLVACTQTDPEPRYRARIERSAGGIPHITANDWGSLGFATGYAQSEDNICILARQYLKFGAQLSSYFPQDPLAWASDYFYQLLIDRGDAQAPVPQRLEEMFAGMAAGYNHYLAQTRVDNIPDPGCRGASWVKPTTALAVKRVSSVDYALDYMLEMISGAQPPQGEQAFRPELSAVSVASALDAWLEVPRQGGSNAIAIGSDSAQNVSALLLANPHMPWNEPFQRFYPMHHIIPGELNLLGANLIGRPRVGFGATGNIAWTSTVSTTKRMSFYQLRLVEGNPTQYLFDGKAHDMVRETVTVNGRSHTFYSTHFGAFLVTSPFFQWNRETAVAVRMHNAGFRGEASAFEQFAAESVQELKAVHDKYQFLSVNLIAADRHGWVMYTDPGPVPYLTDEQLQSCGVLQGAALDGSRSECLWKSGSSAAAPGILPPRQLPLIYRRDYVTNSNDSYWLANPAEPLEGYLDILGSENSPRTLRTRSGLSMVQRYLAGQAGDGMAGMTQEELLELTLRNESYAGQIIRDDLVNFCRQQTAVDIRGESIDLREACRILADWDLHANLDSSGAHLFRQTLANANKHEFVRLLPTNFTPATEFAETDPVNTPRGLGEEARDSVLTALAGAITQLRAAGLPLDARLGELQGVTRNQQFIPLHGGPEIEGIFNKIEASFQGDKGYPEVDKWASSWIMSTGFSENGPRVRGILTYSLSANPESRWHRDQTEMFSRKEWLVIPFTPQAVTAAALETYHVEGD